MDERDSLDLAYFIYNADPTFTDPEELADIISAFIIQRREENGI